MPQGIARTGPVGPGESRYGDSVETAVTSLLNAFQQPALDVDQGVNARRLGIEEIRNRGLVSRCRPWDRKRPDILRRYRIIGGPGGERPQNIDLCVQPPPTVATIQIRTS